tara:strand:+ start:559 stop:1596 length:1038 start_codon:yes stop_codon:yes gene_type:complete
MINVKVSISGQPDNLNIQQFIGNDENIYENIKFHVNTDIAEADFWFVIESINKSDETCIVNPENIIYLNFETSYPKDYFLNKYIQSYMKQFNLKYGSYNFFDDSYIVDIPFVPWLINSKNNNSIFEKHERDVNYFLKLNQLEKTKTMSVICSTKNITDNHKARLNFVYKLKEHFQDGLDWFGEGVNEIENKWEGIKDYKYHVALENDSRNNLISEKIYDSFLGLSLPFYYGGTNVSNYFPKESYVNIDIMDLKKSIDIIEKSISQNTYENQFDNIIQAKNLVLKKYNLFFRITSIVKSLNDKSNKKLNKPTTIKNVNYFWNTEVNYKNKIKHFLKRKFRINVNNY